MAVVYKPGDSYYNEFIVTSPVTGAAVNFDGAPAPTATITVNCVDDVTLTITNIDTGRYKITGTLSAAYTVDAVLQIVVSGTVAGIAVKAVVDSFKLSSGTLNDIYSVASSLGSGTGAALNFPAVASNVAGALKGIALVGSQTANTYASTAAEDGSRHQITHSGNAIDVVYKFSIGAGRNAAKAVWKGYLTSSNDTITVQAYNGATWDTRRTITGTNATTNQTVDIDLLATHTLTGAEAGDVYIRFVCSGMTAPVLNTDQLLVSGVSVGLTVGYADGAIWIDTNNGTAGTSPHINGTADLPVATYADAESLESLLNIVRFHVVGGSSLTVNGATDDLAEHTLIGENWTLVGQNSLDISSAYIEGAKLSGSFSGVSSATLVNCEIQNDTTIPPCTMTHCGISAASGHPVVAASAGQYALVDCFSLAPGSGTPYFNFAGTGSTTGVNIRRWSGGSHLTLDSNVTATLEVVTGGGQTIVAAGASAEIRGTIRALTLTLSGGGGTIQFAGTVGPVTISGTSAGTIVRLYGNGGPVTDTSVDTTISNNLISLANTADAVTDESLAAHGSHGTVGGALAQLDQPYRRRTYVATTGNDANDGRTVAAPKLTITAALEADGDIVVGPGVFSGQVNMSSYSGIRLILDPDTVITHNGAYTIRLGENATIVGNNGQITNTLAATPSSGSAVYVYNVAVSPVIDGLRVASTGTGIIGAIVGGHMRVTNCEIAGCEYGLALAGGVAAHVTDSTITATGWASGGPTALKVDGSACVIAERCRIYASDGSGAQYAFAVASWHAQDRVMLLDCNIELNAAATMQDIAVYNAGGITALIGGQVRVGTAGAAGLHLACTNATAVTTVAGTIYDSTLVNAGLGTIVCQPDVDARLGLDTQGYTTTRAPYLDNLDATVSSRATDAGVLAAVSDDGNPLVQPPDTATILAAISDDGQPLVQPLGAGPTRTALGMADADLDDQLDAILAAGGASGAAADATAAKLETMLEADGLNYRFTNDSLENIDCIGAGAGGTTQGFVVNDDEGDPLDGVAVWATTDEEGTNVIQGPMYTDATGRAELMLQSPGDYYIWRQLAGHNFEENPYLLELT